MAEKVQKPELLAPAGSLRKLRIACLYGADAVYVGGKRFHLRSGAPNLDDEKLAQAVFWAHRRGKKVYVTVNAFAREADLKDIASYLGYLSDIDADAAIVSDPGVIHLARRHVPSLPLHLSTQANTLNSQSILFWEGIGVRRINLAREVTWPELSLIRRCTSLPLEIFVHGAMCISYSGRCLLSRFLTGRSANQGTCAQPCRWRYALMEEKRPGLFFPIEENDKGTLIFNAKDLCLLERIGDIISLGIDALKIEGRMKTALYIATITRAYRHAIDATIHAPGCSSMHSQWLREVYAVSHRPYTLGPLLGECPDDDVSYHVQYRRRYVLGGIVIAPILAQPDPPHQDSSSRTTFIQVRYHLRRGDQLEFLFPDGSSKCHVLDRFFDMQGNRIEEAHPLTIIQLHLPFSVFSDQVVRVPIGTRVQD